MSASRLCTIFAGHWSLPGGVIHNIPCDLINPAISLMNSIHEPL